MSIFTSNIRVVCFDMDGVLYSASNILEKAYQKAVEIYNKTHTPKVSTPSIKEIIPQIGKPVPIIFQNLFPSLSIQEHTFLSNKSLSHLAELVQNKKGTLLSFVHETLYFLKSKSIYITLASNGQPTYLESILQTYRLNSFFVPQKLYVNHYYKSQFMASKGHLVEGYCKMFLCRPQQVIMVGDRYTDYEAACQSHTHFVGVTTGYGTELHQYNHIDKIRTLRDLQKLFW